MDSITVRHHRLPDRNKQSEDDDRRIPTTEHTLTGASIKPATFDGNRSLLDYKSHFEAWVEWMVRKTKGLYLAVSLRGQTQGVLGNLGGGVSHYYFILVNAFEERFLPTNQIELYRAQLREKRQKATGTLPELGQSIRRLNYLAYPSAPITFVKLWLKRSFFYSNMILRIQQSRQRH